MAIDEKRYTIIDFEKFPNKEACYSAMASRYPGLMGINCNIKCRTFYYKF